MLKPILHGEFPYVWWWNHPISGSRTLRYRPGSSWRPWWALFRTSSGDQRSIRHFHDCHVILVGKKHVGCPEIGGFTVYFRFGKQLGPVCGLPDLFFIIIQLQIHKHPDQVLQYENGSNAARCLEVIFTPKFGPKKAMIQQEQEHCLLGTHRFQTWLESSIQGRSSSAQRPVFGKQAATLHQSAR